MGAQSPPLTGLKEMNELAGIIERDAPRRKKPDHERSGFNRREPRRWSGLPGAGG